MTAPFSSAAAQVLCPPGTLGCWEDPFGHGGVAPPPAQGLYPPPPPFPIGDFIALHASLIPKGPNRGKVLVWNHTHYDPVYDPDPLLQRRVLRWAIVDPVTRNFQNFEIALPEGQGDLFCAGHTWNEDGNLIVAGGTMWHGHPTLGWTGAKLVFIYEPDNNVAAGGTWTQGPNLDEPRWYPSVVNLGKNPDVSFPPSQKDQVVVAGGTNGGGGAAGAYQPVDSYQVWIPSSVTGSWQPNPNPPPMKPNTFAGPGTPHYQLWDYPRLHLLGNGLMATAGFPKGSARINHYVSPSQWLNLGQQSQQRTYNSSFLLPYVLGNATNTYNVIVSTGGWQWEATPPLITNVVQWSKAGAANPGAYPVGYDWTPPGSSIGPANMKFARFCHNTVVLPDGTAIAFGGESLEMDNIFCSEGPVYVPEQLLKDKTWKELVPSPIIRNYHSTALLLPSGKVINAGGEYRKFHPVVDCANPQPDPITGPSDYQIFNPPYLSVGGVRPVILDLPPSQTLEVVHGGQYSVSYNVLPGGRSITSVVLIRAGSLTHHTDCNQRCVELAFTHDAFLEPPAVVVTLPASTHLLPAGYYMLFLVTDQGIPSEAAWVHIG